MRRLVGGLGVLIGVIIINFILIRLAPGDPALIMAGQSGVADEQYIAQLRAQFGLDRPLPEQLVRYLLQVVRLDLGYSPRHQLPVADLIFERLPATLLLTGTAFVIAIALGLLLGVLAANRLGTWVDSLITVSGLVMYATPLFWVGLIMIVVFSIHWDLLPAFGMETVGAGYTGLARVLDVAKHLAMPAFSLGFFYLAVYTRLTRASVLEVKDQDFVTTARAKGVSEGRITWVHVLRNAILPVISYAGFQAGHLVGGAVVTETVFGWPGIGRLTFDALLQRDYNLLLGVFLITAALVVIFNIITDVVYAIVDPRIEVAE